MAHMDSRTIDKRLRRLCGAEEPDPVIEALRTLGLGSQDIAQYLDVTVMTLSHWRHGRLPVGPDHRRKLVRLAGTVIKRAEKARTNDLDSERDRVSDAFFRARIDKARRLLALSIEQPA